MSENLSQQKRDIQEGDVVTYMGRDHEVFHIRGKWYGLIDLTRERPMATNQKGEVVAMFRGKSAVIPGQVFEEGAGA